MLKLPLALRFPVVMKDLRFLSFIIKVICIELKNQAMEKLENKSKIPFPSPIPALLRRSDFSSVSGSRRSLHPHTSCHRWPCPRSIRIVTRGWVCPSDVTCSRMLCSAARQGTHLCEAEGTRVPWLCLGKGCPGRTEPGGTGGTEPPQVFLFLDAAHGRIQVLLFTFESVRKRAGKSKRRWWWHAWHCWAGVRVPAASLLPSGSPLQALPASSGIVVPKERGVGVRHAGPLPGALQPRSAPQPLEGPG